MLRFVASFFTPNTKPTDNVINIQEKENSQVDNITPTTDDDNISLTETAEHSNDNDIDIDISNETISEEELSDEDSTLLQSLKKQKQELTQKVLLRKISRQAAMNYYAQDNLPLSQLQEKLEEDNLPLVLLQEKLKQRNEISTYATTKENLKFLFQNQSLLHKILTRSKKSKPASNTLTTDDGDAPPPKDIRDYDVWDDAIIGHLMNLIDTIGMETIQEEASEEIVREDVPKVEKESKLAGKEAEKESNEVIKESKEVGKEADKESNEVVKELSEVVKGSREVVKESREIVKESREVGKESREVGKESKEVGKGIEKELETESKEIVKESKKSKVTKESKKLRKVTKESKKVLSAVIEVEEGFINRSPSASIYNFSEGSTEDLTYREDEDQETTAVKYSAVKNNTVRKKISCESITMAEEIINFGETINVADSLVLSSSRLPMSNNRSQIKTDSGYGENSISAKNVKRESKSFRGPRSVSSLGQFFPPSSTNSNLDRKSSIHSKKSYENGISRCSSVSSKFSINTTDFVMEEPNEDVFENIKLRNKFFTDPKRSPYARKSSNRSLHFLRNLWKSNQNLSSSADDDENFSSNKEFMERYYQQGDNAISDRELNHHANLQQSTTGVGSDTGYSNFYLAMPNGKWMVRTRTASRKIIGTQYVDKEYI